MTEKLLNNKLGTDAKAHNVVTKESKQLSEEL